MKVLLVAAESVPFIKTGGLADVISSLAKELTSLGVDVRIMIPHHGKIKNSNKSFEYVGNLGVKVSDREEYCGVMSTNVDGIIYYFIDNDYYFGKRSDGIYGHHDDGERFAFFNRAVLDSLQIIDFIPNVIHINDWHTGMIPHLLNVEYKQRNEYSNIKTLLSIHNLMFQGAFPESMSYVLNTQLHRDITFDYKINFLKAGIVASDHVVTVSNTYRLETLSDEHGEGLNRVLDYRGIAYSGIVNGIDYGTWNPETDDYIEFKYNIDNITEGKEKNKEILREKFNLANSDKPLIGIVSRLSEQKGFNILKDVFDEMMINTNCQFIVLGSGDREYEDFFNHKSYENENVASYIGYSEELAHLVYAGCDYYLMPSRFEPCGLSQLISIKYGTIPIVRETGGLKDTVIPYNWVTNEGFGFTFCSYNSSDMLDAVVRALSIYNDKETLLNIRKKMMMIDYSFRQSAEEYLYQYNKIINY